MQGGRILVSIFGVSGTGFNLVRANHEVLFEFSWSSEVRAQAIGRIDREGQRHTPHAFQLFVEDNPAEHGIGQMLPKHRQGSWKVSDMRLDGATFYSVGELAQTRPRQHRYESLHIPYQAYLT